MCLCSYPYPCKQCQTLVYFLFCLFLAHLMYSFDVSFMQDDNLAEAPLLTWTPFLVNGRIDCLFVSIHTESFTNCFIEHIKLFTIKMTIRIHTSLFLTKGLKWLFSANSYLLGFDGRVFVCVFIVFATKKHTLICDVVNEEGEEKCRQRAIMMWIIQSRNGNFKSLMQADYVSKRLLLFIRDKFSNNSKSVYTRVPKLFHIRLHLIFAN